MSFVFFVVVLVGIIGGIIAGLFPGIHPNTLAQLATFFDTNTLFLSIGIIVATSINTIISLLPAIFLCVPEGSTIISVLPGQKLVMEGKGFYAILACCTAAVLSLIFLIFILPISFFLTPFLYNMINPYLAPLLTIICGALILYERKINKILKAFVIFLLSGMFGVILLQNNILREPLFAPFIGLFAISNLLLTIKNVSLPKQIEDKGKIIVNKKIAIVVFVGVILGSLADLFPAIGSSAQIATLGSIFVGNDPSLFLMLTTSISISHLGNSFIALHTIKKARIGAVAIIKELEGIPNTSLLIFYLLLFFVSTSIGVLLFLLISKKFVAAINSVDLRVLNILLMIYLTIAVLFVEGFIGIAITALATIIGLLPPLLNIRRTHLMGFLLLPALFYLW